jgi:hypothetical protein
MLLLRLNRLCAGKIGAANAKFDLREPGSVKFHRSSEEPISHDGPITVAGWEASMTTEPKDAKRGGLIMIGKTVACVAVLLSGSFVVIKSNRSAAAETVTESDALSRFECPIQATGNGVAIPEIDPRCL